MIERDAHRFWKDKGVTGAGLREQLLDVVNQLQKAKDKKLREFIALSTSLLKSICYESGIKWSAMGLNEHRYIEFISDPVNVVRADPPPPPEEDPDKKDEDNQDPDMETDADRLFKDNKKQQLADQLAATNKRLADIEKMLLEQHPDAEDPTIETDTEVT